MSPLSRDGNSVGSFNHMTALCSSAAEVLQAAAALVQVEYMTSCHRQLGVASLACTVEPLQGSVTRVSRALARVL